MVRSQPTFARVVSEPTFTRAVVQGTQRVAGKRAETHRGDIHQRHVVRLRAIGPADPHPERLVRRFDRSRRVYQILVADLIDIAFGTECQLGGSTFGPFVDQRSNVAVEGASIEVPLDEVLLY